MIETLRSAAALAALAALGLAAPGCTGGGETVFNGIGNGGNIIGTDALERVAQELAEEPAIPAVTDDDLRAAFAAIREHALSGDPDAALVLLRVAARQREDAEEE
jgi:hypothetical protein